MSGVRTVRRALADARSRLGESAPESAALDAELLLAHALGRPRTWLHAWPGTELTPEVRATFEALLARRARGEPVAYLLGWREFWSLDFAVSPGVLIPRPETEGLVEIVLDHLRGAGIAASAVLDLGTGSGCIAIAIARECPDAHVMAVDTSAAALAVARGNAGRLGAEVEFLQGEWLAPAVGRAFNVIVSNPPYVRRDDPHLERGDVRFEPRPALDGGPDGLDAIRKLAAAAGDHLAPNGLLVFEHGADQADAAAAILAAAGWTGIEGRTDLAGLPRFALARR